MEGGGANFKVHALMRCSGGHAIFLRSFLSTLQSIATWSGHLWSSDLRIRERKPPEFNSGVLFSWLHLSMQPGTCVLGLITYNYFLQAGAPPPARLPAAAPAGDRLA